MRWKQFRQALCVMLTVLMLGVTVLSGVEASAATIKSEPQMNTKQTVSVGTTVNPNDNDGYVTNLKINGKKYSKLKKKVKTVQTAYDPDAYTNYANYTNYYDYEFVADTEDYYQKKYESDKSIGGGKYDLTFLKTGTYKISYDTYESGETKTTPNPDGVSDTIAYELIKTHHVDTYKVVTTTDAIKSITLGKNKITNTYKSNGTKYNRKTVRKFRYLKGKSGKLSFKANKNYKITSAFVVTYDAEGNVVVTASGNKKKVTYGTGTKKSETKVPQYVLDANGNYVYTKDAAGNDMERQYQMVTTATSTSKYKETEIHYGYQDQYTKSYTTYSVSQRQVYVPRKDEKNAQVYEKNPDGSYATDEDGDLKPVIDAVTATVITMTYPQRTIVDGAYKTVPVVEELVVLPGAKGIYEDGTYYMDAKCLGSSYDSGEYQLISKDGVNYYDTVVLEDGRVRKYRNPVYQRKFYSASYQGSWQLTTEDDYEAYSYYADRTIDPKTGSTTYTAWYKWVDAYDAEGKRTEIKDYNQVTTTSLGGVEIFNMK